MQMQVQRHVPGIPGTSTHLHLLVRAGCSMASPEMQQLKDMYAGGMLDMAEFLRMSKDLQQLGGTSASQPEQPEDEQPEDELLVDEHGNVLGFSAHASPTRNAARQSFMDQLLSTPASVHSRSPSQNGSPARSSCPTSPAPADRPAEWSSGRVVWSIDLKREVTFVRLGGADDFVNSCRAKIRYERIKPNMVRAKETIERWVLPESMRSLPEAGAIETPPTANAFDTGRNVSPRAADREAPARSIDLPELAAIERARKMPMKAPAPVRGHNKCSAAKTKESNVSVEQRISEFPDNSLCKDPFTGKLRCDACGVIISNLKSTIATHCELGTPEKPSAHARKLLIWCTRGQNDKALKEDLLAWCTWWDADSPRRRRGTHRGTVCVIWLSTTRRMAFF